MKQRKSEWIVVRGIKVQTTPPPAVSVWNLRQVVVLKLLASTFWWHREADQQCKVALLHPAPIFGPENLVRGVVANLDPGPLVSVCGVVHPPPSPSVGGVSRVFPSDLHHAIFHVFV